MDLTQILEAVIFVSAQPVKKSELIEILKKEAGEEGVIPQEADIVEALDNLLKKYEADHYPFEVRKVAKGYQFFTKQPYYPFVKHAALDRNQKRLTRAALETLSIMAYRQPVTKAEVEFIRGVNCDYAIQKLLEKKLIEISGRADAPGKPLLYRTSEFFMEYFGINGVEDLPKLKEFEGMTEMHLDEFRKHQEVKPDEEE